MFGFRKNATVGNTVVVEQNKYGMHTLFENTILNFKGGAVVCPSGISVGRYSTSIEVNNRTFKSIEVLDKHEADVFGHKVDIFMVDAFKDYIDSRMQLGTWKGAKDVNGIRYTISDVSWDGEITAGTRVRFTANGVAFITTVYEVEYFNPYNPNFVVFTTNAAGTKRYFVFK